MMLSAAPMALERGDEGERHGERQRDQRRHGGQEQRHREALRDEAP